MAQESVPWITYPIRAIFEAYALIGGLAVTQCIMLKEGIYENKLLKIKEVGDMFVTLFPKLKIKPEQINNTLYPVCLDVLEAKLLIEIKQMILECDDQLEIDQAINNIKAINAARNAMRKANPDEMSMQ